MSSLSFRYSHVSNVNVGPFESAHPLSNPCLDSGLSPVIPGEQTPLHGGVCCWKRSLEIRQT